MMTLVLTDENGIVLDSWTIQGRDLAEIRDKLELYLDAEEKMYDS